MVLNNNMNFTAFTFAQGVQYNEFANLNFIRVNNTTIVGDRDLYTCPVGRRATILTVSPIVSNTSYIKISSTTYLLNNMATYPVLQANDTFGLRSSTAGTPIFVCVVEFADTVPYYSPRLTSLTSGNNTIYTCPVGKSAAIIGYIGQLATGYLYNASGSAVTNTTYALINGTSVGAGTQIVNTNSTGNNSQKQIVGDILYLNDNDSIVLNSGSTLSNVLTYINVLEM